MKERVVLERIVDLHAHLFNARYLPLASIIAHAMGKDRDPLADAIALLLEQLTGSSYDHASVASDKRNQAYFIARICDVVEHELRVASVTYDSVAQGAMTAAQLRRIQQSLLMHILRELDRASGIADVTASVDQFSSFRALATWSRKTVTRALKAASSIMKPQVWGEAANYIEFFFTLLSDEERMYGRLVEGYGEDLPPMRAVHYMMDMQMAYGGHRSPYYPFRPDQLRRMQDLQRAHPGSILGFAAFDPRRDDWEDGVDEALSMGFMGFKFYPAMEYKPIDNEDTVVEARVRAFFSYCIERNVPVFTHCTPQGFQTRHEQGLLAHPKLWRKLLQQDGMSQLRLCLGHAGGGISSNKDPETGQTVRSAGWMAKDTTEWNEADNFARICAELCCTYPNVYCELGHLDELLHKPRKKFDPRQRFRDNLARARQITGESDFMDKLAYGSDWHMPTMIRSARRFLDVFLDFHGEGVLDDRFFWKNAYAYLGT